MKNRETESVLSWNLRLKKLKARIWIRERMKNWKSCTVSWITGRRFLRLCRRCGIWQEMIPCREPEKRLEMQWKSWCVSRSMTASWNPCHQHFRKSMGFWMISTESFPLMWMNWTLTEKHFMKQKKDWIWSTISKQSMDSQSRQSTHTAATRNKNWKILTDMRRISGEQKLK